MSDEALPSPNFGHVKIARKAYLSDPLWQERREYSRWEAWEDMIQLSAWAPHRRFLDDEIIVLERGEFLGSLRFLATRWVWTIKRVRTFLIWCVADDRIRAQREAQHGTVYLLVNYEKYQGRGTPKGTEEGTPEAQHGHSAGTLRAQRGHKEEAVKAVEALEAGKATTGVSLVRVEPKVPTRQLADITARITSVFAEVVESGHRTLQIEEVRDIQAEVIFAYWASRMGHPLARLDLKREARIKARLAENDNDVNELLFVVDGARKDDHLMGKKDGKKYDGIDTIFRDRGQVERLAELGGFKPDAAHPMAKKYAAIVEAA